MTSPRILRTITAFRATTAFNPNRALPSISNCVCR